MTSSAIILLAASSLLVVLMATDRIAQGLGRPPSPKFDLIQLLAAVAGVMLHAVLFGGPEWAVRYLLVTAIVPFGMEWVGLNTGFPFGRYAYTRKAGPALPVFFGKESGRGGPPHGVPLSVIIMWWGLLYVATNCGIAAARLTGFAENEFAIIIFTVLAITGWDLVGDPVAVHAGLWTWHGRGKWHGIPASNFAGWIVTASGTLVLARIAAGPFPGVIHSDHPSWITLIPTFLFGLLLLNYAGAAWRRKLKWASAAGLVLGMAVLFVFFAAVL